MKPAWAAAAARCVLVAGGLLCAGSAVVAADAASDGGGDSDSGSAGLQLDGSARAGYFSRSRTLDGQRDMATAAVWLQARAGVAGGAVVAEGWAHADRSLRTSRGPTRSDAQLREAYYAASFGNTDLRLGKQIIAWGRADEINPTDRLTPRDYTLLVPERSDQRLGLLAMKATQHFEPLSLTAIWMPGSKPNVLPVAPVPGVRTTTEPARHAPQGALKLERSGGDIDWSLSWFRGHDTDPDLAIAGIDQTGLQLVMRQPRVDVFGFDMAGAVGGLALRAEAAYSRVPASRRNDPLAKQSNLYAVVGGDWDAAAGVNINVQYIVRRVSNYSDPRALVDPLLQAIAVEQAVVSGQLDRFQHGISLRAAKRWLNDTLQAEVMAVYSLTYHDIVLRPKATYAISDRWKLTLGADLFRGDRLTYFGRLRGLSMGYAELRVAF